MKEEAEGGDADDGDEAGEEDRPAVEDMQPVDRIHAAHHELGIADPYHVDDAEDEVEPEREQRQHPAEQYAVDDRLEEINVHGQSLSQGRIGLRPCVLRDGRFAASSG